MFKHILIPTDGSELSNMAIANGIKFAKDINARVTGLTVTMPFHFFALDGMQIADTAEQYAKDSKALAMRNLTVLKDAASAAGVECELVQLKAHESVSVPKTDNRRPPVNRRPYGAKPLSA